MFRNFILLVIMALFSSCNSQKEVDLIVHNALVYTVDDKLDPINIYGKTIAAIANIKKPMGANVLKFIIYSYIVKNQNHNLHLLVKQSHNTALNILLLSSASY